MTLAPSVAAGTGFCVPCYAAGQTVLAVDPADGGVCVTHRAQAQARVRLTHAAQRQTAEQLVAAEAAGQLALTGLATVAAASPSRPAHAGPSPSTSPARGWTPTSAAAGDVTAVETTETGQDRLVLAGVPRRRHPTGVQENCARCAERGVPRQGMPYRFAGDPTPLCIPCWRGEQQRRRRDEVAQLNAQLWAGIGAAEAATACPMCGPDGSGPDLPLDELLPPTALRTARELQQRPLPARRRDCYWCGDQVWLAQQRAQFARDQASAEARVEEEFARIAARTEAEERVEALESWIERLRTVLGDYAAGGRRGRAVELLAELAARDAAARTTARGRPGMLLYVGGVLAVDSDWRSGRRGMPGRARTAELVGCSEGAVTAAWSRLTQQLQWAERTKVGGRLSLAARVATGRFNDRAEFDIAPAHRGDLAARARHVPAALRVLGELLEHACTLLTREQDALDELRARTETVTDWPEQVRRAQLRHAVDRLQQRLTTTADALASTANICTPHMVSKGEYLSSCSYLGLRLTPDFMIHSPSCPAQRRSRRRKSGASRSSTKNEAGDLESRGPWSARHRVEQPRTLKGAGPASRRRRPPTWSEWAGPLARELVKLWPWLDGPGRQRARVAATLGARLGPHWTAAAVVDFVTRQHGGPPLADPHSPLSYLAHLLEEALTGDVEPPAPARLATVHRHAIAQATGAVRREHTQQARKVEGERSREAVHGVARSARDELAALRARLPEGRRRADRVALLDEQAGAEEWPEVRPPGSGLPPGWSR